MTKGFNCATPLTNSIATAFKADGYDFVVRYIDPNQSSWKRLSNAESAIISAAGLQIISVFERMGSRANINGFRGASDGLVALQAAQDLGQPEGSTIYFAVDYDAQPSDMDSIEAYIRAAAIATPQYSTGIYGSYAVIEEMKKRGACSHFWQTYAWSGNLQSSSIQIYQYNNDITVHGIGVDLNESYGNEGWWNTLGIQPMSAVDANKIIEFLKAGYDFVNDTDSHAEFKRVANELRRVSGQAQQ
ncbi:MAG: hypothetical protein JWM44_2852 [Bacilli bacterium]|nr:hypothetical protein [Bacilli bacterium]